METLAAAANAPHDFESVPLGVAVEELQIGDVRQQPTMIAFLFQQLHYLSSLLSGLHSRAMKHVFRDGRPPTAASFANLATRIGGISKRSSTRKTQLPVWGTAAGSEAGNDDGSKRAALARASRAVGGRAWSGLNRINRQISAYMPSDLLAYVRKAGGIMAAPPAATVVAQETV